MLFTNEKPAAGSKTSKEQLLTKVYFSIKKQWKLLTQTFQKPDEASLLVFSIIDNRVMRVMSYYYHHKNIFQNI